MLLNRDRRLWPLLALLLCGLSVSGYKMVSAFTGDHTRPEYESSAPAAFARQAPDRIVDAEKTKTPRLPDEAYASVTDSMTRVAGKAATFTATAGELTAEGMSPEQARTAVDAVELMRQQLGAKTGGSYQAPEIAAVTPTSATVTVQASYDVGAGAPLTATLTGIYGVQGIKVTLQSLTAQAGVLGSAPAADTDSGE